jgi:hypothetical protein
MKKYIVLLATVLTLPSCVSVGGYEPEILTGQGQEMFYTWFMAINDCAFSHARPAILLEEYQNLDEAHRQNLVNKYFSQKIVVKKDDLWVVLNSIDNNYDPMIEVEYLQDTALITVYDIAYYVQSDFDFSQDGVIASRLEKDGENYSFKLSKHNEADVELKLNNMMNILEGQGFMNVARYGNHSVTVEFEILRAFYYSTANIITDGEVVIKAFNFKGQEETVNVEFKGNSAFVTFRGVTERTNVSELISNYNYNNYY